MSAFHDIVINLTEFEEISAAFQTGLYNYGECRVVQEGGNSIGVDWCDPQSQEGEVGCFEFEALTSGFHFTFESSTQGDQECLDLLPPLFEGSQFSAKDVCRFLLHIKNCNAVIGDRLFASFVGTLAVLLPRGNFLTTHLKSSPSMYHVLKLISQYANLPQDVKVLKIPVCKNGCRSFSKDLVDKNYCPECGAVRWEECTQDCLTEEGELQCEHTAVVSGMSNYVILCFN